MRAEEHQINLAYLAGLVDADGCISLAKVDTDRFSPSLSFVNTSFDLITLFKDYFGGFVFEKPHKHPQKPVFEIKVREAVAVVFALNRLIPYLRYKQQKALIVRDYAYSIMKNENRRLDLDVKAERKVLRQMWEELVAL